MMSFWFFTLGRRPLHTLDFHSQLFCLTRDHPGYLHFIRELWKLGLDSFTETTNVVGLTKVSRPDFWGKTHEFRCQTIEQKVGTLHLAILGVPSNEKSDLNSKPFYSARFSVSYQDPGSTFEWKVGSEFKTVRQDTVTEICSIQKKWDVLNDHGFDEP
jgi:hypothetical protein